MIDIMNFRLNIIFAFFILFLNLSCSSKKVEKNFELDFEKTVTDQNYFWQSNTQEFFFKGNHTILARIHSYRLQNSSSCRDTFYLTTGKWYYNPIEFTLEISWLNKPQAKVTIDTSFISLNAIRFIDRDFDKHEEYNGKIFECSSNLIRKMKIIDNRFNRIDSVSSLK